VTPTARRAACSLATLVSLDGDRLHLDVDFIEDAPAPTDANSPVAPPLNSSFSA
jgi:hypothetical protein